MNLEEKLKSLQEQVQNFDPSELSADNIGTWPLPIKIICWVLAFVIVIAAGMHFIISDLQQELSRVQAQEGKLKEEYATKAFQAANLGAYREQMVEMEASFGALVSQLPSDTEVPGLLEDITNKGVGSGLTFSQISLQNEVTREFYVELPIRIVVSGTYHDMGAFVSGVAGLPRIVTLRDFTIRPSGARRDNSNLQMTITASTYRYRDTGGGRRR